MFDYKSADPFMDPFRAIYLTRDVETDWYDKAVGGLRPFEAFYSDIANHLVRWAQEDGHTQYFETKKYWYCFGSERLRIGGDVFSHGGVIHLQRFELNSSNAVQWFSPGMMGKEDTKRYKDKWELLIFRALNGKLVPFK